MARCVAADVKRYAAYKMFDEEPENGTELWGLARNDRSLRPAYVAFQVAASYFSNVTSAMRIAQEEIFGPVLSIMPYDDVDQAVAIANDTVFGLGGHVQGADLDQARGVALRIRTGQVHLNHPASDARAPFGGYKQSGNGREYGIFGFEEFLETKAVLGFA